MTKKTIKFAHVVSWFFMGGTAVIEQGLFSGTNFIFNIFLARWLSLSHYGAFALSFSVYLFLSGFHNALILEPMSVFATSKYKDRLKTYLSYQVFLHFLLTTFISVMLFFVVIFLRFVGVENNDSQQAIFGIGIFLPLLLIMWLVRRICYIVQRPLIALLSTFIYSLSLLGGALLYHNSQVTSNLILWFGLMGLASLLGSLGIFTFGGFKLILINRIIDQRNIFRQQWMFGRWILLAAIFSFAGSQIQIFLAALFLGIESAGVFRALQNFALPMMQGAAAITNLGLPLIAREFGKGDLINLHRKGLRISIILTVISGGYAALLFGFSTQLEQFLYGGKFSAHAYLIPLIGLGPVLISIESGFSLIVRSLQRPVYYVIYSVAMAIMGIGLSPLLILHFGLYGAVISQLSVGLASLSIIAVLYRKWFLNLLIST